MRRFGEEPGVGATLAAATAVPVSGIVLLFGALWLVRALQVPVRVKAGTTKRRRS